MLRKQTPSSWLNRYAVVKQIDDELAFAWWVQYMVKKWEHIISKAKSNYWRTTHKYGVRLPKSVEEGPKIDDKTNTNFWETALNKEMKKAKVAYEEVEGCAPDQVRTG